jgi:hypothetical protein
MRYIVFAVFLLLLTTAYAAEGTFVPSPTVSLAATGTTSRVAVSTGSNNPNIRLYNSGTVPVFVTCGEATVVATLAASMPVAPGTVEVIGCPQPYVAGITASSTATLYLTPGVGN